jgi:hypothetical protein
MGSVALLETVFIPRFASQADGFTVPVLLLTQFKINLIAKSL